MKKAVIYEYPGADRTRDKIVRDTASGWVAFVPVNDPNEIPSAARELVEQGVALVELCGGVSPVWRAKVNALLEGRALVSSVTFGFESLAHAAAFSKAASEGKVPPMAYILLEEGADPKKDRFLTTPDRTPVIPVPNEVAGAQAASELAQSGITLMELYGGFTIQGVAAIIEAVRGRAAVGVGSFTLDQTKSR